MLDLKTYLTASGSYPEREQHKELTQELLTNADQLLMGLNNCLKELGIDPDVLKVSSGFRPSAVNAATKGAAKASYHTRCLAVDLVDTKGDIFKKAAAHPEILRKYGFFIEDKANTPTWCHFDLGTRADRPSRVFKP